MMSPAYDAVWAEWFGYPLGRGVGNPTRDFIADTESFIQWIQDNEEYRRCSFVSVQPFEVYEKPVYIERLVWDFDCEGNPERAGDEILDFKARLERFYNVKSIIVFSGNKGYHIYVYLKTPIGHGLTIPQLKAVYNKLMHMLAGNTEYESMDSSVVGDIKQLIRIPYTHHEKSKKLCIFVDEARNPIMVLPGFTKNLREHGLSFEICKEALYKVGREEKERRDQRAKKPRHTRRYNKTIRPCIQAVLDSGDIHAPHHKMKLAAVAELNANGWGEERIIGAFMRIPGVDERKTSYFVRHAIRKGYRPSLCTTIQSLEGCLESECPIYRRRVK